jgi:hypothetical protein
VGRVPGVRLRGLTVVDVGPMPPGGKREGAGAPARVKGETTTAVGARLTADELAAVDAYAAREQISRSEAIRRLIAAGVLATSG